MIVRLRAEPDTAVETDLRAAAHIDGDDSRHTAVGLEATRRLAGGLLDRIVAEMTDELAADADTTERGPA